jgi:hypothetical protein
VPEGVPLNAFISLRTWWAAILVLAVSSAQAQVPPPSAIPQNSPYVVTPPPVMLGGDIQPVDPYWDPYADPAQQAPALLPPEGAIYTQPDGNFGVRGERLIQQIRVEYTHLLAEDPDDVQIDDVEVSGTIGIPFYYGMSPVLFTPGFAVHFWDGPDSSAVPGADLPGQVYDAWLDIGWRPQLSSRFTADLGVRPGLYSDFEDSDDDAFRLKARALGILTASPQLQIVAGVLYLDRTDIRLLPAGGVIWTPNEIQRYEILFPRPKLAWRLTTVGNTEWWWYVAGEFGGDTWSITRADGVTQDTVDYFDIRAIAGLEWNSFLGYRGNLEVGYVFNREFDYENTGPDFEPGDTFMVRGGITY